MAFGIGDLLQTMQQGVSAINNLTTQIRNTFPSVTALSTSATTGTITFSSSQPAAFQTIISASGATYKVPLYNS
jgi:hypothetical protein